MNVPHQRRRERVKRPNEVAHEDRRSEELQREIGRRGIVSVNGQDVSYLDVRERHGEETSEVEKHPKRGAA